MIVIPAAAAKRRRAGIYFAPAMKQISDEAAARLSGMTESLGY
jgi:hypothetical protein